MILSDRNILTALESGSIEVDPFSTERLQPASVDLLLGWTFKTLRANCEGMVDPKLPMEYDEIDLRKKWEDRAPEDRCFFLLPGTLVLGTTIERLRFSAGYVGRLEGKSSLGRIGLSVHSTAGFFDPGFSGEATLELINHSGMPIRLYPEMKIAQMSFHVLSSPAARPYGHEGLGSKYLDQTGPTESLGHLNFARPRELSEGWKEWQFQAVRDEPGFSAMIYPYEIKNFDSTKDTAVFAALSSRLANELGCDVKYCKPRTPVIHPPAFHAINLHHL